MNKTTIKAEIVADSLSPQGDRLTSLLITFPRIILAEINTHRMLSKNTSSSRAIPFKKMVEAVQNDPFIPIAWQKEHKGMQGSDYITNEDDVKRCVHYWIKTKNQAIENAKYLNSIGATKQLCNRLLEPFMWTTMLITGSKEGWDNFFYLRCPQYEDTSRRIYKSKKDYISFANNRNKEDFEEYSNLKWLQINKGQAEIHMMDLAEKIYDAMNESVPEQLSEGMWHIPFMSRIDSSKLQSVKGIDVTKEMIKISTAMAARTSYTVVGDEKDMDYQKMIELHDRLIAQEPPHSSPLEHCARVMSDEEYYLFNKGKASLSSWDKSPYELHYTNSERGWCGPYKGFISYRYFIDNNLKI